MAPNQMFNDSTLSMSMNMDGTFSNHCHPLTTFNAPSFGSLSWGSIQQHQPSQLVAMRHEDNSDLSVEPYIKLEDSPSMASQISCDAVASILLPPSTILSDSTDERKPAVFSTDIDSLMRAIQAKEEPAEPRRRERQRSQPNASTTHKARKRYQCAIAGCGKAFYQKTHLEIHTRAHTGVKPFACKELSCGQRFSQLGNLKTHERRHTGERPYHCDICGKTFAQHGNVRAHKIVHTAAKPFTCKLDGCNKQFTQLGNLKSHQNKFHIETIRRLKDRFETFRDGDRVDSWEKEMWEYFGSLYKNCNKGIRGRGKDRRIGDTSKSSSTASRRGSSDSSGSAA